MAQAGGGKSKNSRTAITAQKFFCPCGGEVKMKELSQGGKRKLIAECLECKRIERRPTDFM